MMLVVDGEEHQRHRAPFRGPFKLNAVRAQFTDVIAENVDRLLAAIEHDGHAELAAAFTNPFAVTVASDVLHLGFEHADEVHEIYGEFATGLVGYRDPQAVGRAREASASTPTLLDGRASIACGPTPDESMLSVVVNAQGDERLSEDQLFANLRVILFGAIETVESMILNTTWALLHHPDQQPRAARGPRTLAGRRPGGPAVDPTRGLLRSLGEVRHAIGRRADRAWRLPAADLPRGQP